MSERWPAKLWLVRHGQSVANVDSQRAEAEGALVVPLHTRDMDTPLSEFGEVQAVQLGKWLHAEGMVPDIILASPYLRTRQTAQAIVAPYSDTGKPQLYYDERLRERERGVFDGLTRKGVEMKMPDQAEARIFLGKFYHRAPGGESWCDVVQRLRPVVDRLLLQHAGKKAMIIAHEVVIYCLRYILENMDEAGILAIDAAGDIPNCSVTEYCLPDGATQLELVRFGTTPPTS
jgi:ribonuclease H / adenosylcobalamin/alpha-ribazole phosphatase